MSSADSPTWRLLVSPQYPNPRQNAAVRTYISPHARRAAFGFAECGRRRLRRRPHAPVRFRGRARAAQFPKSGVSESSTVNKEIESRGGARRGASQDDLRSKTAASSPQEGAALKLSSADSHTWRLLVSTQYPNSQQNAAVRTYIPPHARRAAFGFAECGWRRLRRRPHAPVRESGRTRAAQFPLPEKCVKFHFFTVQRLQKRHFCDILYNIYGSDSIYTE